MGLVQWFPLCGFSRVSCVDTNCYFCNPLLVVVCGGTGVVFGPTLVVGHGITLFRCFVFLLLWLVRDWLSLLSLVCEAHPPTLFR
ncbi:hypothetical protein Taro_015764 [Colocasia esculenta]|uniref:Uncharacterized protein n=1 Tax=Colocasia esculenta TaxID=4460 RepID=A0A843UU55_COLES|nr:hypothetical protein [Colocasia esculenta]